MSSAVRFFGGWRLSGTVSSVIAPPFHRSSSSARLSAGPRCTVMATSSSRVRSSCLRSLSVVVGACHTLPRSSARARTAARSVAGEGSGACLLAVRQLGFGVGLGLQGTLPFGFQATRHEPVLGIDGPVPAFGSGGLVAGLLHLAAVLVQRGVVAGLQLPGGGQAGLQRGGSERGQERPGDRGVDRGAADPQVPVAAAGSRRAAGAVVAGRGLVLPVVVDGGLAAADAAGGQGLQVRGALPDRAGARGAFRRRDVAGLAGAGCPGGCPSR